MSLLTEVVCSVAGGCSSGCRGDGGDADREELGPGGESQGTEGDRHRPGGLDFSARQQSEQENKEITKK